MSRHTVQPLLFLLLALACSKALAQQGPAFAELSGRVVDNADMISPATEQAITARLRAHEQATGEQVVVVTLADLQGYTIEEFGYRLGRHWGIGEKDKDTGALLLVAREERAIRIEVGYGLEGKLTDALSGQIITGIISPRFKQGDFDAGISQGVDAMLAVLGGDGKGAVPAPAKGEKPSPLGAILFLIVMAIMMMGGGRGLLGGFLLGSMLGRRGGFGGGGFGGGGFSGGGGGFGGGGASGGW